MEAQNLEQTKTDRLKTHGDYADVARISQRLTEVFREEVYRMGLRRGVLYDVLGGKASSARLVHDEDLDRMLCETIEMILHKIARIVAGDATFPDHWHDISGYADITYVRLPSVAQKDQSETTGNADLDAEVAAALSDAMVHGMGAAVLHPGVSPFDYPTSLTGDRERKSAPESKAGCFENVMLGAFAISPLHIRITKEQTKVKPGVRPGEYIAAQDKLDVNNWLIKPTDEFDLDKVTIWHSDWPVDVYTQRP